MTSDELQTRLCELRQQWRHHPDRRAEIEDQADQIRALHMITAVFPDAVVIDRTEGVRA